MPNYTTDDPYIELQLRGLQLDPTSFGGVGNGSADDTTAVQNTINAASAAGGDVVIPNGLNFLCTKNINVPVSLAGFGQAPYSPNISGGGWTNWGITFSGPLVTTGFTYNGGLPNQPSWTGSITNLAIRGINGAKQGITYLGCTKPLVWQSLVYGFAGPGIYGTTCILPTIEKSLLANCGSPTRRMLEIDNSTTTTIRDVYMSGGAVGCIGGLAIDRTQKAMVIGGAIESCGTPIAISCAVQSSTGCTAVNIIGIDLENPGNGNPYIDVGSAMTGGGLVSVVTLDNWTGSSDTPTTSMPCAVRLANAFQVEARPTNFNVPGSPIAAYQLVGTSNIGVHILPHRNLYGNTYPWVTINGVQVKAASPAYDWMQNNSPKGLSGVVTDSSITGSSPSILVLPSQGGFYSDIFTFNASPTTMTLSGGEAGMQIVLVPLDGNTTYSVGSGPNQFSLKGSATTTANQAREFISNGTYWIER